MSEVNIALRAAIAELGQQRKEMDEKEKSNWNDVVTTNQALVSINWLLTQLASGQFSNLVEYREEQKTGNISEIKEEEEEKTKPIRKLRWKDTNDA